MSDVTDLLNAIDQGKPQAANQLVPLLYDELRRLAAARLADESPGQTLDATALVHEAYIRLVGDQAFENRRHFFAAAAEAMRRVLVDRARARLSLKRGRDRRRVDVSDIAAPEPEEQLFALDAALSQLARDDPLAARVVELHHFAGMRHDQVAAALELSIYQVRQKWGFARAWLKAALEET